MHAEFLLEEPSSEAFLAGLLPRVLPEGTTWNLHVFQGKTDLLKNLGSRLKAYKQWIPNGWRIVVLVDEDRQDCRNLKTKLEADARAAGFRTKTSTSASGASFTVLNRIAVEELEAWFFGDIVSLTTAFPGVPASLNTKAKFHDPDAIAGGTWEALEKVLQKAGHFVGGMPKIEVARTMGALIDPQRNTSRSFQVFIGGLTAL